MRAGVTRAPRTDAPSGVTPAVLGVDVGTSASKAILVTLDGTVLATAVREHAVDRPRPGHVEMDGGIWWDELVSMTAELLTGPAGDGVEVTGIGLSGMGPCVLLAEADGTPVRPAILYGVDTRAGVQIDRLRAELGDDAILERCGCVLTAQAAGPKIAWVAEEEPGTYARARRLFMTASHLAFRLTGQYVLDHASASQAAPLYDLRAGRWDEEWAAHVAPGIDLPELRWAGEAAGTVTAQAAAALPGIAEGTPVITGTIDAWAEARGAGTEHPGDMMLMYGTTTFLVARTAELLPGRELWATAGTAPGGWTLSGGMAASGAITGWLRELTGGDDYGDLVGEAAASGPGARGLLMLPYVAGERSPLHDPDARGVIAGLTLSHTRGDLYRAALEAAALGVRHHLEAMTAAGARIDRVVAVGGGARTDLWPQIVSDVTGLPQRIPRCTIGACYGGAMLAAELAHGIDTSPWQGTDHEVRPDPALRETYDELYGLYRDLYPATRDVAHALARRQREA